MPLIYTSNQELIDHHLKNAQDVINAQTTQLKSLAGTHTAHATEVTKQFMGDYTSKAQEMLRGRQASGSPAPAPAAPAKPASPTVNESDFPAAPKEDIRVAEEESAVPVKEQEPLIAA